jgi:hypothetical protein
MHRLPEIAGLTALRLSSLSWSRSFVTLYRQRSRSMTLSAIAVSCP